MWPRTSVGQDGAGAAGVDGDVSEVAEATATTDAGPAHTASPADVAGAVLFARTIRGSVRRPEIG
jgi:hypothetical protein